MFRNTREYTRFEGNRHSIVPTEQYVIVRQTKSREIKQTRWRVIYYYAIHYCK